MEGHTFPKVGVRPRKQHYERGWGHMIFLPYPGSMHEPSRRCAEIYRTTLRRQWTQCAVFGALARR